MKTSENYKFTKWIDVHVIHIDSNTQNFKWTEYVYEQ